MRTKKSLFYFPFLTLALLLLLSSCCPEDFAAKLFLKRPTVSFNPVYGGQQVIIENPSSNPEKKTEIWYSLDGTSDIKYDPVNKPVIDTEGTHYVTAYAKLNKEKSDSDSKSISIEKSTLQPLASVSNIVPGENDLDGGKKVSLSLVSEASDYKFFYSDDASKDPSYASKSAEKNGVVKYTSEKSSFSFRAVAAEKGKAVTSEVKVLLEVPKVTTPSISNVKIPNTHGTQRVTISGEEGSEIHYSLSGGPSILSTKYTDSIDLTETKTVQAIAFKPGYANSSIATVLVEPDKLEEPTITVVDIIGGKRVTIAGSANTHTIYYCLKDENDWKEYTGPFDATSTAKVRAYCSSDDFADSDITQVIINVEPITCQIIFTPIETGYQMEIIPSVTGYQAIYFTTNGSSPQKIDLEKYTGPVKLESNDISTIKTIAIKPGYSSVEVQASILIGTIEKPIVSQKKVSEGVEITISRPVGYSSDYYDNIYYVISTNGVDTVPEISDAFRYSGPFIVVPKAFKLCALATKARCQKSDYFKVEKLAEPKIDPKKAGDKIEVTLSAVPADCVIKYSINNDSLDKTYNGIPFKVNLGDALYAQASKSGYWDSDIIIQEIALPKTATPLMHPSPEVSEDGINIVFECTTPNAKIHYKLGNSLEVIWDGKNVFIPKTTNISVWATCENYLDSDVFIDEIKVVKIILPDDFINKETKESGEIKVSFSTASLDDGVKAYYTIDGKEPTRASEECIDFIWDKVGETIIKVKAFSNGKSPSDCGNETLTVIKTRPPVLKVELGYDEIFATFDKGNPDDGVYYKFPGTSYKKWDGSKISIAGRKIYYYAKRDYALKSDVGSDNIPLKNFQAVENYIKDISYQRGIKTLQVNVGEEGTIIYISGKGLDENVPRSDGFKFSTPESADYQISLKAKGFKTKPFEKYHVEVYQLAIPTAVWSNSNGTKTLTITASDGYIAYRSEQETPFHFSGKSKYVLNDFDENYETAQYDYTYFFAYKNGCKDSEGDYRIRPFYQIGEKGPGGGYVFFIDTSNKYDWDYMEITNPKISKKWGAYQKMPVLSNGIGEGISNTSSIVSKYGLSYNDTSIAASYCNYYSQGGKYDWFLPSRDELEKAFINLKASGKVFDYGLDYWSSSIDLLHLKEWGCALWPGWSANDTYKIGYVDRGNLGGVLPVRTF
jgi:hypothetical protein